MSQLSRDQKVARINKVIAQLVAEYVEEGEHEKARQVLNATKRLDGDSMIKLFDIFAKV